MTVNLVYLKLSQYHVYGVILVSKLTFKIAGCQCRCKSLFCVPNSHLSCMLSALKAEITCNENTEETKPSASLHGVSISSKTCQTLKSNQTPTSLSGEKSVMSTFKRWDQSYYRLRYCKQCLSVLSSGQTVYMFLVFLYCSFLLPINQHVLVLI